jgi:hypothetical protein
MRSSIVALTNSGQNSFLKFEDINTKVLQVASPLGHIQRELQGNVGTSVLPGPSEGAQVDDLPIEDYVR